MAKKPRSGSTCVTVEPLPPSGVSSVSHFITSATLPPSPPSFSFLLPLCSPPPSSIPSPSNPFLLPSHPGYHNIDLELQTPTELNYEPPTPLRSDEFFSEGLASAVSPTQTTLSRPSDLSLTQTTSVSGSDTAASQPPTVIAEDTSLTGRDAIEPVAVERPGNDRRAAERSEEPPETSDQDPQAGSDVVPEHQGEEQQQKKEEEEEEATADTGHRNGQQAEEEDEEMTQERLRSLLEDINLEGGLEDVEMTEEGVKAILEQVRLAEKDMCSVPGWRSETSGDQAAAPEHGPGDVEGR